MALIDDPKAWILRMFEMEEREGRGEACQRFDDGCGPRELPLVEGELVYGIYKEKYWFTPKSFIHIGKSGLERIPWNQIGKCSSQHGENFKRSRLSLRSGREIEVQVGDMATGWQGRISQLFHQMIERHGSKAALGGPLMSIEDFLAQADYDLFANVSMSNQEILDELRKLESHSKVEAVYISVENLPDEPPYGESIVVIADIEEEILSGFADSLKSDGFVKLEEPIRRKLPNHFRDKNAWHLLFD